MKMDFVSIIADTAAGAGQSRGGMTVLLIYVLLFAGMWFLLIAPQRKRQKNHQKMINTLEVGDKVVTTSGVIGTIANVKKNRFVVKISDNTKIEMFRSYIQAKLDESDKEEVKAQ
jgi:preprotein translocase subunit YajC